MTSRSLCFKLMREDLKRRVWTIALTILSFLFTLLVPAALKSGSYLDEMAHGNLEAYQKIRLMERMTEVVGMNGVVVTMLLVLSVVWALSGFRYLHNSRQVDFYHSIPVKRHQLFLAQYFNGLLVPAVFYLIAQGASVALILRTGIGAEILGSTPWRMFLVNMVYYGLMYTTTVIAMMMTGNLVVALLGTSVFCGYGPAVIMLIIGYQEEWFHTIYRTEEQGRAFLRAINYSSPFANYMLALGDFSSNTLGARRILEAVAATTALGVLAYGLYQLRPSEAAGRAMAFKRTRTPIKLLIALPVAVVFSIFFYELRSTLAWGIFGAVCGSVLTCCLMEIIYHFDFRKLFANWIHMAGCCLASVLLLLAGMYDWYGYDSYIPKATDVKSAAVVIGYTDSWITYGKPETYIDSQGMENYKWGYEGVWDYQFKHMELTDLYPVMELAKKGVEEDQARRAEKDFRWGYGRERYIIGFRLNNGKTIYRQYYLPLDEGTLEARAMIHDSREYKKGVYPLLEQMPADTASVYFQQYNQQYALDLDQDEKTHLLAVYQKELEELTMARREEELPVGSIQFRTAEHDHAITQNQNNSNSTADIEGRCYYPVYPSFTRTLEIIEKAGVSIKPLNSDDIVSIDVQYYWVVDDVEKSREDKEGELISYRSAEEIEALLPALVYRDYLNFNEYYEIAPAGNVDVMVSFAVPRVNSYGSRSSFNFQIDLNRLSDEDIERFEFYGEKSYD